MENKTKYIKVRLTADRVRRYKENAATYDSVSHCIWGADSPSHPKQLKCRWEWTPRHFVATHYPLTAFIFDNVFFFTSFYLHVIWQIFLSFLSISRKTCVKYIIPRNWVAADINVVWSHLRGAIDIHLPTLTVDIEPQEMEQWKTEVGRDFVSVSIR